MPETYTRDQSLDIKAQFFLMRNPSDATHPLHTHRNVTVIAKVRIGEFSNYDVNVPPGYESSQYTVDADIDDLARYTPNNATAMGKRFADWFEYQGLVRGKGLAYGGLYAGAVEFQNFGNGLRTTKNLMLSGDVGYIIGFHSQQIQRNSGLVDTEGELTLGDFTKAALQAMKTECDNRNLCYPLYIIGDLEEVPSISHPLNMIGRAEGDCQRTSHGELNCPVGPLQTYGDIYGTSSFDTEIAYSQWNGSGWTDISFRQALTEYGLPTDPTKSNVLDSGDTGVDSSQYWFLGRNQAWTRKSTLVFKRMTDHGLYKTIYEPAKEVFPHIQGGNFDIVSCIDSANPFYEFKNNWWTFPYETRTRNRYLMGDFSVPVCYSPDMSENRYAPGQSNPLGSTARDVYRNYIVAAARACISGDNPTACIPYIEPPYENVVQSEVPNAYPIHYADESDILYILQEHYKLGVRSWAVFNPSHSGAVPAVKGRMDALLKVINDFLAWIQTRDRKQRIIYKS